MEGLGNNLRPKEMDGQLKPIRKLKEALTKKRKKPQKPFNAYREWLRENGVKDDVPGY